MLVPSAISWWYVVFQQQLIVLLSSNVEHSYYKKNVLVCSLPTDILAEPVTTRSVMQQLSLEIVQRPTVTISTVLF